MRTYNDATLEHYADQFIRLRLARHGVTLEQYLANPARFERLALEPEPPLPAQQAAIARLWWEQDTGLARDPLPASTLSTHVADRLIVDWQAHLAQWRDAQAKVEGEVAHLPRQNNGHIVQPLKHHAYPRSSAANFAKRGA